MKHLRLARCLPWLLIAVCPPLLGHCGGAVEHGTETGNPPVIEQQKLHVVLHDDGVVVVGDPGAVSPGASVAVTNTRTGAHAEASAGSDGSVSVSVHGTLDDEYEVTVSSEGRSQTVQVSASSSTTGAGGAGGTSGNELASASCDSLEQTLSKQVASEYNAASTVCQVDSDCTWSDGDFGCRYTCGGGPIISVAGLQAARRALLESTAPVCAELTNRCPGRGPPGCPFILAPTLACNDGTCGQISCETLEQRLQERAASRIPQIVNNVNNSPDTCTQDQDCRLVVTNVRCVASCGNNYASVPLGRADQLAGDIKSFEDSLCEEFEQRSCPGPAQLPCDPPLLGTSRAACVAGKCDIAYVPGF
jgi:hypothetical protein